MTFWAVLTIAVHVALLALVWTFILHPTPNDISEHDLDSLTCDQMRASGWGEDEIKQFMEDHNGEYCAPSGRREAEGETS